MKPETETEHADDEDSFCPHCFARDVALQLLDGAIANCVAAGCDPDAIQEQYEGAMGEWFEVDDDGEMTADTPTAGSA